MLAESELLFYSVNYLLVNTDEHNHIWFQATAGCGGVLYLLAPMRIILRDVGVEEL